MKAPLRGPKKNLGIYIMILDFCAVCGANNKEDLHQHHILPVVTTGIKRINKDPNETVTLCSKHHDMMHGVMKNRKSIHHKTLVRVGIDKAKARGTHCGRPTKLTPDVLSHIHKLREQGYSIRGIKNEVKLGVGTVMKALSIVVEVIEEVKREPATFLDLYDDLTEKNFGIEKFENRV